MNKCIVFDYDQYVETHSLCFPAVFSRQRTHVVEETILHRDTKLIFKYVDCSLLTPLSKKKLYHGCSIPCQLSLTSKHVYVTKLC